MGKDRRRVLHSRAQKQARRNARKKRRARTRERQERSIFSHIGCTRAELAQTPVHGAWVSANLFKQGIGSAVIARRLPDGRIFAGVLLLDVHCQGVKDAYLVVEPLSRFEEFFAKLSSSTYIQPQSPEYVAALAEQTIEFARRLGIEPHEDYNDAALAFLGIDAAACGETFVFGHDGKPLLIPGPHDSPTRIRRILAELKARLGPDGFEFVLPMGDPYVEWEAVEDFETEEEDFYDDADDEEPPEDSPETP